MPVLCPAIGMRFGDASSWDENDLRRWSAHGIWWDDKVKMGSGIRAKDFVLLKLMGRWLVFLILFILASSAD